MSVLILYHNSSVLVTIVGELTDFTSSALSFSNNGVIISPNISIDDFRVLYQTSTDQNQKILTSWQSDDNGFIVLTSEKIAGEYICLGSNQYGEHSVDVTISIAGIVIMYRAGYIKVCLFHAFILLF